MVHAFVPQHLLDFAEYIQNQEYSAEHYDLQKKTIFLNPLSSRRQDLPEPIFYAKYHQAPQSFY